jgi:hypothetical protein
MLLCMHARIDVRSSNRVHYFPTVNYTNNNRDSTKRWCFKQPQNRKITSPVQRKQKAGKRSQGQVANTKEILYMFGRLCACLFVCLKVCFLFVCLFVCVFVSVFVSCSTIWRSYANSACWRKQLRPEPRNENMLAKRIEINKHNRDNARKSTVTEDRQRL